MKEKGQVFTTDMIFAVLLTAAFISVSGHAYDLAASQIRSYSTRYSLERSTNDAADVMVKSPGEPENWIRKPENLEVLGLAVPSESSTEAVPNLISVVKLTWLRELTRDNNWDPDQGNTLAIMKLFGGTQNFEVTVEKENVVLFNIFPGWDVKENSGVENSLEVASVKRLGYLTSELLYRLITRALVKLENNSGVETYHENWRIREGELDVYNWFFYLRTSENEERDVEYVKLKINGIGVGPGKEYMWEPDEGGEGIENLIPLQHSGMDEERNLVVGLDNLDIEVKPDDPAPTAPDDWAQVSVVAAPDCFDPNLIMMLKPGPIKIRIKVWK